MGTRVPSLPFVTRSLWTLMPARVANDWYSSLVGPSAVIETSSGSFFKGLPVLILSGKVATTNGPG